MPHGRGTTTSMHIDVIAVSASNVWPAIRHHHHQFSRCLFATEGGCDIFIPAYRAWLHTLADRRIRQRRDNLFRWEKRWGGRAD